MKVIFTRNVPKIGVVGDVKEVKDGYARNFLFPKKLATRGTQRELEQLNARKIALEKKHKGESERLAAHAKKIEGTSFVFPVRTNEEGGVFGSVTEEMIEDKLSEEGPTGGAHIHVSLEHPLKTVGEHEVKVEFAPGIEASVRVILRPQS